MRGLIVGSLELDVGEVAELYHFVLADGTPFYYTNFDIDLNCNGFLFQAGIYQFDRDAISTSVGVEVDDVTVTIYPGSNNTSIGAFCNAGGLDGAWVTIYRSRSDYTLMLFHGIVTDATADRSKVELTLSSGTVLLNVDMPRNIYTAGCINTLFDSACGLSKASFANTSSTLTGSTSAYLLCGLTQPVGYFDLGTITMTSGANSGVIRTIKSYDVGAIGLSYPLPHVPAIGDTFTAYPGCDKRLGTCSATFSNSSHFRGFPFIPTPEDSV